MSGNAVRQCHIHDPINLAHLVQVTPSLAFPYRSVRNTVRPAMHVWRNSTIIVFGYVSWFQVPFVKVRALV